MDDVVPAREIIEQVNSRYPVLQADPNYSGEVAERWRYADGSGEVGVIASVTQAFCHECTRARLSTDGKLYTCLFSSHGIDLRGPLRAGASEQALTNLVAGKWERRFDRYSQLRHAATEMQPGNKPREKIEMSYIGG